jgi:predicted regulator of Ras-like GTPase activity (Roadblock/LC7/MglB family)
MPADSTNVPAATGDYHLNLTREVADRLRLTMKEFLLETECRLGAVIERSGAVIVSEQNAQAAGRVPRADSLGALAAGLFGSTQVLASQLGETEAPEVICHGSGLHIFLSPISEEFALLAVFPNRVAVGLVRLQAKRAAAQILADLRTIQRNRTTYAPSTGPVRDEAGLENPFLRYN